MEPKIDRKYTAFADSKKVASGGAIDVAAKVKKFLKTDPKAQILIFDNISSNQIEIDFRGTPENVIQRLEDLFEASDVKKSGPGRPKLGVTAKEVTLLPDHWEWLARQPGGASVTLRRLVEEAKKKNQAKDLLRQAQESTYKFMTTMAGDLPHYEEALRALYAGETTKFEKMIADWPKDIREHTWGLAETALKK
ncbi:DUF2239 family protein [Bdellovibrio sp.]|uniref:DUF2239 family protein n=1 Tax=Bdellovibrio sp. TaxID=28201 RepID=UPI0039E2AEA1